MSNKRKLLRELRKTLDIKQDVPNYISGILGAVINGEELVAVPGRNGFVYVRLRNSESEFIQAFNETVNNVYGLPVLLEYDKHYYNVVGKDTNRYSQWGSGYGGAQLAAHGDQHSFGEGSNTGTDIVWVYKRQFMPLLVKPSNPFSMSVAVEDDWYQWNNELKHYTGTSIDLTAAKPGNGYSRFITLYVDATTNTVKGVTGSNFNSSNYGASVESYIPTVSQTIGIPVGSVRVDGTGTDLRWSNLYDIRSLWTGPSATLVISDDSVIKVTGTAIDFGAGLDVSSTGSVAYVKLNYSGTFTGLIDTPNSYAGQSGKYLAVNGTENALIFVTGTSGGGSGNYTTLYESGTYYGVSGTTSETDILSFTVPGNSLKTDNMIIGKIITDIWHATLSTMDLYLYYGGVKIGTLAMSNGTITVQKYGHIDFTVSARGSASSQIVQLEAYGKDGTTLWWRQSTEFSAIDSSTDQTMKVAVKWDTSNNGNAYNQYSIHIGVVT